MSKNQILTTGEVADYCGVHYRTVLRWIKDEKLNAYRLPNGGEHRVKQNDFICFLEKNNIPIPEGLQSLHANSVMIIDDDTAMAKSMYRLLKRKNIQAYYVTDSFIAGCLIGQHMPAVISLDLNMPKIDGQQIIHYLKSESTLANIKILVVSANPEAKLQACLQLGADDYLIKPFEPALYIKKIEALLQQSHV